MLSQSDVIAHLIYVNERMRSLVALSGFIAIAMLAVVVF